MSEIKLSFLMMYHVIHILHSEILHLNKIYSIFIFKNILITIIYIYIYIYINELFL